MKKILLIGSTGQVGQELLTTLQPLGELVTLTRQQLDLTQSDEIKPAITSIAPDIVVNASAYTAVDKAETDSEMAMAINAVAPKIMAQATQEIAANLVHISTDYVFDGKHHTPYLEEDAVNPLGIYGQSKLLGEQGISQNSDRYIILRTAWVYGSKGHGNFVKTMLRLGASREELKVVADQIGSPTWSYDIADAIANLVNPHNQIASGIYHFTNSGVASWYDFALAIFEEAAQLGFPLKIKTVLPITTAEYPTPAARPHYSVLSKGKYTKAVGVYPPYWQDSLQKMLVELHSMI
ncbi:dTDP-4-dehydrorhamnose reductase subunit, NAD(P)-binding, of dTDP-L-rhamnose synthase [Hyella patelloides LEGE 07179]|uniref:dTDP-4-dehydrorhamnose reductase n=1 Tax=Hyella patelloides LEGE 07179 TaxID=945734 RepID=A0A563VYG7_9CYAN|nr:dTDP-4-dehydrorhamnose reductase [Hyella patelloides]VEP16508.1 dTDP-4-dehydrorhamnose reductase subunit, NAD(P)-binding, of dTDP-L-rhamnose synthase [Hyella patelloides LEGE 07179]